MCKTRQVFINKIQRFISLCLDNYFVMPEVGFDAIFSITCEKNLIFGGIFPYWRLPGTDYPAVTERECVNALECLDRPYLGPGIANTFNHLNYRIDNTFEYYCHMHGERGDGNCAASLKNFSVCSACPAKHLWSPWHQHRGLD